MPTFYVPPASSGLVSSASSLIAAYGNGLCFAYEMFSPWGQVVEENTDTKFEFNLGNTTATFRGTGLRYEPRTLGDKVVGGTLTSITVKVDDITTLSWTGLNLQVSDLNAYSITPYALAELMFGKNDTFRLTDQVDFVEGRGGNDIVNANGANDYIRGGTGNDQLNGGKGNDTLDGGTGNDQLNGGEGNDTFHGGDGKDKLSGGVGFDTLTGGTGNDQFIFTITGPVNRKTITDFTSGADKLVFGNEVFTGLATEGALAADDLAFGVKAADASDRFVYHQATGSLWYDRDGKGGGGQTLIADLQDGAVLVASDILVI